MGRTNDSLPWHYGLRETIIAGALVGAGAYGTLAALFAETRFISGLAALVCLVLCAALSAYPIVRSWRKPRRVSSTRRFQTPADEDLSDRQSSKEFRMIRQISPVRRQMLEK